MNSPRILIVDSSVLVRERMVAALIRGLGQARIEEAESHAEALMSISRFAPEIVLFDAGLSLDGLAAVVRWLSRRGSSARVIVLAADRLGYSARCTRAGAVCVVDRSDSDSIVQAVKSILDSRDTSLPQDLFALIA